MKMKFLKGVVATHVYVDGFMWSGYKEIVLSRSRRQNKGNSLTKIEQKSLRSFIGQILRVKVIDQMLPLKYHVWLQI